jgi:hypothetical protein
MTGTLDKETLDCFVPRNDGTTGTLDLHIREDDRNSIWFPFDFSFTFYILLVL